jgi:hypothetical protein
VNEKRLEKVLHALSGRERAVLFLREYKDGTSLDPSGVGVAFLTPKEHREYARLIDVIRLCNNELSDIVMIVKEQVTQEELRFSALEQMRMAADDLWLLGRYVKECVPEPVTASVAKARKREPKCGFHVYDDEWATQVAVLQEDRKLVGQITGCGYRLKLPFDMTGEISANPKLGPEMARLIVSIVRDNVASAWKQLKAVDTVIAEFAEEFGGEDPLKPPLRAFLDDALSRCVALKDDLQEYVGVWELPDDLGEALVLTRKLAERASR